MTHTLTSDRADLGRGAVMNRDDYMSGAVDHQTYYQTVADAIGRGAIERLVLQHVADIETIGRAMATDPHMNNIPLAKWDRLHPGIVDMVGRNGQAVMAISGSDKSRHNLKPGSVCWSLAESVCVAKACARRMALEARHAAGEAAKS